MSDKIRHPKKIALLQALEKCLGVVTTACKMTGIHRDTFYEWLKKDPKFRDKVEAIGDVALDFAESQLFEQIKEHNAASTIFYLKTKGKRRGYIERQEIDVTQPINVTIEPQDQNA